MLFQVLVARKKEQLLATEAQIIASMPEGRKPEPIIASYKAYVDATFPFMKDSEDTSVAKQKEALKRFIKYKAKIDLRSFYQERVMKSRRAAAIRSFKKVTNAGPVPHQPPRNPPRRR